MQINMKKQVLFLGMVMLLSVWTMAQPGAGMRNGQEQATNQSGDRLDRMAEKLDLTPEQKTKFDEMMVAHYKIVQPLQNQMREKRASLKTLTTSESIDQKKIDKVIDEIGMLENSLLKAKTNHQIAVRAMLTDKQKMMFDMKGDKKSNRNGRPKGSPADKPNRG
ncbi:MAG: Spy/CpxP family protein refolding chaperone [Cyclobacteriaceae bacterium]|jgi:Spy/CpxP family protein refolding chaperone